jgi:hypothetical protein
MRHEAVGSPVLREPIGSISLVGDHVSSPAKPAVAGPKRCGGRRPLVGGLATDRFWPVPVSSDCPQSTADSIDRRNTLTLVRTPTYRLAITGIRKSHRGFDFAALQGFLPGLVW